MNTMTFTPTFKNTTLPTYVSRHGTLTYHDADGGYLCILGGRSSLHDVSTSISTFQIFNISDGLWFEGPEMPQNRSGFTSIIVDNYLYAIGGYTNIVIRMYIGDLVHISNYQWETLNDTLSELYITDYYQRSVVYQSNIFVLGAYKAPIDVIHTDSLTITRNISSLITNVRRAGIIVADDMLYVFGGFCNLCYDITNASTEPRTYQYAPLLTLSPTVIPTPNPTAEPTAKPGNGIITISVTISDLNVSNQTLDDIAIIIVDTLTVENTILSMEKTTILNDTTLVLVAFVGNNSSLDTTDILVIINGILDDTYSDFEVSVEEGEASGDDTDDVEEQSENDRNSSIALWNIFEIGRETIIYIMIGVVIALLLCICCGSCIVRRQMKSKAAKKSRRARTSTRGSRGGTPGGGTLDMTMDVLPNKSAAIMKMDPQFSSDSLWEQDRRTTEGDARATKTPAGSKRGHFITRTGSDVAIAERAEFAEIDSNSSLESASAEHNKVTIGDLRSNTCDSDGTMYKYEGNERCAKMSSSSDFGTHGFIGADV